MGGPERAKLAGQGRAAWAGAGMAGWADVSQQGRNLRDFDNRRLSSGVRASLAWESDVAAKAQRRNPRNSDLGFGEGRAHKFIVETWEHVVPRSFFIILPKRRQQFRGHALAQA